VIFQEVAAAQEFHMERRGDMRVEYSNLTTTTSCGPAAPVVLKGEVLRTVRRWQSHTPIF
jgi:hypothetical protein